MTDTACPAAERGTWVKPRTETVCSYDRMRISWNINVEEITRITPDWEPPLQFNIYRTQDEGISSDNPVGNHVYLYKATCMITSLLGLRDTRCMAGPCAKPVDVL